VRSRWCKRGKREIPNEIECLQFLFCICKTTALKKLFKELFEIRRSTYLFWYCNKICLFPHFSFLLHHFFIFSISASLFPFFPFALNINPSMAAPFAFKNLGDLSKNNPAVKELLVAILKAVEHAGAHKVTGRKQGVSYLLLFIFLLVYCHLFFFFSFFLFSHHGLRLPICLLSGGQHVSNTSGPRRYMISITRWYHYERVSAPRSHSTSNDPGDHEDLSELDQLCLRLYVEYQEALDIQEAIKHDNLLDKRHNS
jgi:hypothetical protein